MALVVEVEVAAVRPVPLPLEPEVAAALPVLLQAALLVARLLPQLLYLLPLVLLQAAVLQLPVNAEQEGAAAVVLVEGLVASEILRSR